MLHQLANKGSTTTMKENAAAAAVTMDLPLFKGLVTTTLTTLHTRLLNECDKTLSMILLDQHATNCQEQLSAIISDLYKMTEMVNWTDNPAQKREIKENITQIEAQLTEKELNIIQVKDIISTIKQIMNTCICQYYRIVEKAIIIPSKGYKIEGSNTYNTDCIIIPSDTTPTDYRKTTKIDHMDMDAYWYRNHFTAAKEDIHHFFGYNNNDSQEPILISIQVEENKEIAITNRQYRIICRSKKNNTDQRRVILDSFLLNAPNTTISSVIPDTTWKSIIETTFNIPFSHLLKMSHDLMISSGIHDELTRLDENLVGSLSGGIYVCKYLT
jgi:hypothetical protein